MKQSTKRKIKKGALALTEEVLFIIKKVFEMFPEPFEMRAAYIKRLRGFPLREVSSYQLQRAIGDLERQRLIRKKLNREKIGYELTDLGRAKAIKLEYKRKPKLERKDGLSTIVIFDIPEKKKRARDFLRRFLLQNDFTLFQESILISRFRLHKEFKQILSDLDIEHNVKVFEGRVILI